MTGHGKHLNIEIFLDKIHVMSVEVWTICSSYSSVLIDIVIPNQNETDFEGQNMYLCYCLVGWENIL